MKYMYAFVWWIPHLISEKYFFRFWNIYWKEIVDLPQTFNKNVFFNLSLKDSLKRNIIFFSKWQRETLNQLKKSTLSTSEHALLPTKVPQFNKIVTEFEAT